MAGRANGMQQVFFSEISHAHEIAPQWGTEYSRYYQSDSDGGAGKRIRVVL